MTDREAVFFRTPADWRAWLEAQAGQETELWVAGRQVRHLQRQVGRA